MFVNKALRTIFGTRRVEVNSSLQYYVRRKCGLYRPASIVRAVRLDRQTNFRKKTSEMTWTARPENCLWNILEIHMKQYGNTCRTFCKRNMENSNCQH
jgi:hypothetical protein